MEQGEIIAYIFRIQELYLSFRGVQLNKSGFLKDKWPICLDDRLLLLKE